MKAARNDRCPCGSGAKCKRCWLPKDVEAGYGRPAIAAYQHSDGRARLGGGALEPPASEGKALAELEANHIRGPFSVAATTAPLVASHPYRLVT
jgi:hypothetical protein